MEFTKFEQEIQKTGYILENRVFEILKTSGWSVISNRYYEDDVEGSVREMDVLAYKTKQIDNYKVVTTLLISCKKNAENAWVFISRKINANNPNVNWKPFHFWANVDSIKYEISQQDHDKKYAEQICDDASKVIDLPEEEVFAFQEMKLTTGTPQNDKSIFNSITSLMKAQAYELDALSHRMNEKRVYQFNLLSIIDAEMIRISVGSDGSATASKITETHYLTRYIIKKKEEFNRIRFIDINEFKKILSEYDSLHDYNCIHFEKIISVFYTKIETDYNKLQLFLPKVRNNIKWHIYAVLGFSGNTSNVVDSLNLWWNKSKSILELQLDMTDDLIEKINKDERVIKNTKKILKDYYRYSGEFEYVSGDGLPF